MISKKQQKLIRQLEKKKFRLREGLFVAEGPKVVSDLIRAGITPKALFTTEKYITLFQKQSNSLTINTIEQYTYVVTEDELQRISFLQHPQQVLGLFSLPEPTMETPQKGHLYLALDGVQDPGNLGTIIRLADWFGIETIYCSDDTADAWAPKVVQATMGSIARIKVVYTDLIALLRSTTLPVYGTLLDGSDIYREEISKDGIIVMGNEGNGISPNVRELVTRRLLIPPFNQGDTAESLNVAIATAITCSEFRRRKA